MQAEQDHYTGLCSNHDNKRPLNKCTFSPGELSSERGEKEVLADSKHPMTPPSTKSHVSYCTACVAEERKWRPKVHQARRDDRFSSRFSSLLLTAAIVVELLLLLLFAIVVELLVLLLCILTCKQVFSSSSIQGHLPWLRCSFDLVVHRPHCHHPFSLALRRPLRLATSQPRSGLGV